MVDSFLFIHLPQQIKQTMRVDFKKFAKLEYESKIEFNSPFQLGDVVIKHKDYEGNVINEIGVVIQIHDINELRTDMFGNESVSSLKLATRDEIRKYRPELNQETILFALDNLIEIDGEKMELIIDRLHMTEQIHRQLVLKIDSIKTLELLREK